MSRFRRNAIPTLADQAWERSRLEWRIGDGGDPLALIEEFLTRQGIPVSNLVAGQEQARNRTDIPDVIGATLYVSAAAAASAIGAPAGAPTPTPGVPDLAAIVWGPPEADVYRESERDVHQHGTDPWRVGPWESSWQPSEHSSAVTQVREAISRGDVYQVNLVGHASAPYTGDPGPALRRVCDLPGARYAGTMTGAGWAIACASPETLVSTNGEKVFTGPIKGTRPATRQGRAELLSSAKERAEHIMIVDLARNDLARIARTGSVTVEELYEVRRWCDLWQAESTVSAAFADGVGLADLLRAVAPGGSVTGAPKRAALALIAEREPVGRGAGMGAFGWVDHAGLDLGLTIRTVAVDGPRVHRWAGGGITWGSDPAAEVAEAAAKAEPLQRALAGPPTPAPARPTPGRALTARR